MEIRVKDLYKLRSKSLVEMYYIFYNNELVGFITMYSSLDPEVNLIYRLSDDEDVNLVDKNNRVPLLNNIIDAVFYDQEDIGELNTFIKEVLD